jgi:curved DNA-binding protein CbpA
MAETFYSILDVSPDAGTERIREAYRELAKDHHPDVSDDPRATERFKRLTTARDVLVDSESRTRYDRLGHEAYVSQYHKTRRTGTGRGSRDGSARAGPEQSWQTVGGTASAATRGSSATGAGSGGATIYRRPGTGLRRGDEATSAVVLLTGILRELGPWLLFHLVFLSSALTTGLFLVSYALRYGTFVVPIGVFSVFLVVTSLVFSGLHLLSTWYA